MENSIESPLGDSENIEGLSLEKENRRTLLREAQGKVCKKNNWIGKLPPEYMYEIMPLEWLPPQTALHLGYEKQYNYEKAMLYIDNN